MIILPYIFDIETYKDENNSAIPYSVGLARLCKFRTYLGDLISSEENIPKEKYDRLIVLERFHKSIYQWRLYSPNV